MPVRGPGRWLLTACKVPTSQGRVGDMEERLFALGARAQCAITVLDRAPAGLTKISQPLTAGKSPQLTGCHHRGKDRPASAASARRCGPADYGVITQAAPASSPPSTTRASADTSSVGPAHLTTPPAALVPAAAIPLGGPCSRTVSSATP